MIHLLTILNIYIITGFFFKVTVDVGCVSKETMLQNYAQHGFKPCTLHPLKVHMNSFRKECATCTASVPRFIQRDM